MRNRTSKEKVIISFNNFAEETSIVKSLFIKLSRVRMQPFAISHTKKKILGEPSDFHIMLAENFILFWVSLPTKVLYKDLTEKFQDLVCC